MMFARLRSQVLLLPTLSLSLFIPAAACAADGFTPLAKTLARAAAEAGVQRVAVVPFLSLEAALTPKGRLIAQTLSSRMTSPDGPKVVDLTKVDAAILSLGLKDKDLTVAAYLAMLARELDCQALVTGSWAALGREAGLKARLYHVGTGVVLTDQETKVQAEWLSRSEELLPYDPSLTAAEAMRDVLSDRGRGSAAREPERLLALSTREQDQLRDAVSNSDCAHADEMISRLEASVLALKARYWADQVLRGKLSEPSALRRSEDILRDPLLRERYETLFRKALAGDRDPLSVLEVKRFITYDRLAYETKERCAR
ncbi:MAG: hypothetical protein WC969_11940 [Elusimicrobiota bacterium]|jgi:hypothetical protein